MENNHIVDILPDYLDGLLGKADAKKVEGHLEGCGACTQELDRLKTLFEAFASEEKIRPSAAIRTNFLRQLEEEKNSISKVVPIRSGPRQKSRSWTSHLLKIAAGIVLLVAGFLFGRQQATGSSDDQIARLTAEKKRAEQVAMISLMENKSASRRIQGVNSIEAFEELDQAIVKALADRMLHDDNTNVRAAAVEVLASFTRSENVKNVFIKALKIEKNPGIQIDIIRTLGEIQEKKAAVPMKELLKKEETLPFVKEHIESVLPNII